VSAWAQCWICGRACPPGVGESLSYFASTAYTTAHVNDGRPCAERWDYYTEEDQAANLEALLAEIGAWPSPPVDEVDRARISRPPTASGPRWPSS
jgi:hypothetical protein